MWHRLLEGCLESVAGRLHVVVCYVATTNLEVEAVRYFVFEK